MEFNVFLLLGFVSCVSGYEWTGPVVSNTFETYIGSMCLDNWEKVRDVDACSGCFFNFSSQRQSQDALNHLVRCGQTYLTSEPYNECVVANNSDNVPQTYCNFEKCIKRVSTEDLGNEAIEHRWKMCMELNDTGDYTCWIKQCMAEASADGSTQNVSYITDVIACVIANYRCLPDPNYTPYPGSQPRYVAVYVDSESNLVMTNFYPETPTSPCNTGPNGEYIYNQHPIKQATWRSAQCYPDNTSTGSESTPLPFTAQN